MSRLLVICGPTATGKTDLAINLAKKFNGEIVSADSKQVYRGMDIGTGKDLPVSSKFKVTVQSSKSQFKVKNFEIGYYDFDGMKVWLLDVVEPDYQFNVADYKEAADLVISNILGRGKLPILVGGTGLYIKAVVEGIGTLGVPPDWELRKRSLNCSIVELLNILRRLDSKRAEQLNNSDRNNPRRLIRAIEIALWKSEMRGGKLDNEAGSEKKNSHISLRNPRPQSPSAIADGGQAASNFSHPSSVLLIGLTAPYKILYQKIDQRADERIKQGIEREIKDLIEKGYSFKNSALGSTIGYREWQGLEVGSGNLKARKKVIQQWKINEHAYARRQMTWFKKDKRIKWLDISGSGWEQKADDLIGKWIRSI